MTDQPLSPAAQAVMTACNDAVERLPLSSTKPEQFSIALIAAALRAAVDQVLPAEKAPKMMHLLDLERLAARQHTRAKFLAIAAELEGQ
jgi:hypothetical protein